MATALLQSGGSSGSGRKSAVEVSSDKPKKLSKAGEWLRAHPTANCANGRIINMRAVMK